MRGKENMGRGVGRQEPGGGEEKEGERWKSRDGQDRTMGARGGEYIQTESETEAKRRTGGARERRMGMETQGARAGKVRNRMRET